MPMIKNDGAVQSQAQGLGRLVFRFQVNGTSDPDNIIAPGGVVSTLTYTGTEYVVTLASGCRPSSIVNATVTLHSATASDFDDYPQACIDLAGYNASTGVFDIRAYKEDTASPDGAVALSVLPDNMYVTVAIDGVFDSAAV